MAKRNAALDLSEELSLVRPVALSLEFALAPMIGVGVPAIWTRSVVRRARLALGLVVRIDLHTAVGLPFNQPVLCYRQGEAIGTQSLVVTVEKAKVLDRDHGSVESFLLAS